MSETRMETRAYKRATVEYRSESDTPTLVGYSAVFNSYSQNLGGFVEIVDEAAFNDTLARGGNVLGCVNHDVSWLLASTESDTMTVETDTTGLRYTMMGDLSDPDWARAVAKVKTGKLRGSSFMFRTIDDDWSSTDEGFPLRRLLSVELIENGPVAAPAYRATGNPDTQAAIRSLAAHMNKDFADVAELAARNELRSLFGTPAVVVDEQQPASNAAAVLEQANRRAAWLLKQSLTERTQR